MFHFLTQSPVAAVRQSHLVTVPRRRILLRCLAILACFVPTMVHAQEQYEPEALKRYFQRVAESYEMQVGEERLKLRKSPVLLWENSEREQLHGALYVWERDKRPAVLGSIFTYEYGGKTHCRHEMLSIANEPLSATLDSEVVWSPSKSRLKWEPLENAPKPSASVAKRLTQMRALARRFTGKLLITNRQPSTLRLLTHPLVRYESKSEGVIDGAIFAFAVSTDAEILLLLEARKKPDGSAEFMFAAAPAHYHALELKLNDQIVWTSPTQMPLEMTLAGERPWSLQPFFIFTPRKPLPAPSEL